MSDLNLFDGAEPFDAIRQVREDGSEYWSARDLAALMGYSRWENLIVPLNRAMKAALNTGADLSSNFLRSQKISATRPGEDFDLSRYGAYLLAMNCDPNKVQVATAQTYFAVKTREAEVSKPVHEMDELEVAEKYVAALKRERALELTVAEQAPKVEAFESYMDADNALGMGAVANQLGIGRNTMMRKLREAGVLQKDNRPYQRYAHHFKVVAGTYEAQNSTRATHTTYVKPSGVELIRQRLIEALPTAARLRYIEGGGAA